MYNHNQDNNRNNALKFAFPGRFIAAPVAGGIPLRTLLACLVGFLVGNTFLHFHIKFIYRIGFVTALVTDCTAAVGFIFIYHKSAVVRVFVNTESLRTSVILSDKSTHVGKRQVHRLCPCLQFFNGLRHLVGLSHVMAVGSSAVRTGFVKIINPAITIITFNFHSFPPLHLMQIQIMCLVYGKRITIVNGSRPFCQTNFRPSIPPHGFYMGFTAV